MSILLYKETELYYEQQGSGPCVVLLHGFLENSSYFDQLSSDLEEQYRVVKIDLLGHGKTGNLGYIHSMEDMADAVYAVIHELKIRKAIFIGHSMGGYVSLAFADLYPDMVKGLCLLNSSSRADSPLKKKGRDAAIRQIKNNASGFIRHSIPMLFRPKNKQRFKEEIKILKQQALKCSVQGIVAALEGMKIREDREVLLHFGPYPKLIITGKKDQILPLELQIEQTSQNKVDLDILPDGHMSLIENYTEALFSIKRFLKHCLNAKESDYLN